jgi:two-component system phosphate regulon sensor histidine kinase PhoR
LLIDDEQRVLYANKAAKDLLEAPRTGLVGRPLWESARHPQLQKYVEKSLRGRSDALVELEVPRLGRVVALSASRVPSAGAPGARGGGRPGVVIVLQDVTELRRLENMRREFVSNVSHELKTPLTAIQAYTETLLNGAIDDPEHNREFVSRISEQGERLHHQIIDLLSLARIESGAPSFEIVRLSIAEEIQKCVRTHAAVADGKSITLSAEGSTDACDVMADAEGVREIFDNLIDNAINYTPEGGRVSVSWSAEAGRVRVSVADTGPGIAEEHQKRIFERFYRVDRARSRELGGTGLGLSIVKHLVHVFQGSIEVESTLGKGSTFTVRLPRATPSEK